MDAALKASLISGGIAAGVPLAVKGIHALTPAAREERKLNAKMRQDAIRTYERGKEHGFGPGKATRNRQVARRMKDYDRQNAAATDALARQESLLGIGRSGAVQEQRANMAEARGNALGQTRAQVESEAREIGRYREAQALNNLNRERGVQAAKNQENLAFFTDVAKTGVSAGAATYKAAKDAEAAAALNEKNAQRDLALLNAIAGNRPDPTR